MSKSGNGYESTDEGPYGDSSKFHPSYDESSISGPYPSSTRDNRYHNTGSGGTGRYRRNTRDDYYYNKRRPRFSHSDEEPEGYTPPYSHSSKYSYSSHSYRPTGKTRSSPYGGDMKTTTTTASSSSPLPPLGANTVNAPYRDHETYGYERSPYHGDSSVYYPSHSRSGSGDYYASGPPIRGYHNSYESGYGGDRSYSHARKRNRRDYSPQAEDDFSFRKAKKQRSFGSSSSLDKSLDTADILLAMITRVGDTIKKVEEQLDSLHHALSEDIVQYGDQILMRIIDCATELSTKTPVYATLIGLFNHSNSEFAKKTVDETKKRLLEYLKKGDWMRSKLLVRFLCELLNANVLTQEDVITLLNAFVNVTESNKYKNKPLVYENYIYIVIAALPWVGRILDDKNRNELNNLINRIDSFMEERQIKYRSSLELRNVFPAKLDENDKIFDYLETMWSQLKVCKDEGWRVASILKPYLNFELKLMDKSVKQISLFNSDEVFVVPDLEEESSTHVKFYKGRLGLYDVDASDSDEDKEEAEVFGRVSPVDTLIVEEYVTDILFFFNSSHNQCVKQLLNLPVRFSFEHLLLDVIFGHLLMLPSSPFKSFYYSLLLIELLSTTNLLPVIAWIEKLFDKVNEMDLECFDRYVEFLAYHLSYMELKWKWDEWKYVPTLVTSARKYIFVQELFSRIIRLTPIDHLKQSVPKYLEPLLPPVPAPVYKYGESDKPFATEAVTVLDAIKSKKETNEVKTIMDGFKNMNGSRKLDILVNAILLAGSDTPSLLDNLLSIYKGLICEYLNADDGQWKKMRKNVITRSISEFWRNSPQHSSIIMDHFWSNNLIDHSSILTWLLHKENLEHITRPYLWGMIKGTLEKLLAKSRGDLYDLEKSNTLINYYSKELEISERLIVELTNNILEEKDSSRKMEQKNEDSMKSESEVKEVEASNKEKQEDPSVDNNTTPKDESKNTDEQSRNVEERKERENELMEKLENAEERKKRILNIIKEHSELLSKAQQQYPLDIREFKEALLITVVRIIKLYYHLKKNKDEVRASHLLERWKEFVRRYQRYIHPVLNLNTMLRVLPLPALLKPFHKIWESGTMLIHFNNCHISGKDASLTNWTNIDSEITIAEDVKKELSKEIQASTKSSNSLDDDEFSSILSDLSDEEQEDEVVPRKKTTKPNNNEDEEDEEMKIIEE